jgi:hypothetical protein
MFACTTICVKKLFFSTFKFILENMYKKIWYLICSLLLGTTLTFAQNKDLKTELLGKRWGLSYFIEQNGNLYDTLIRVHDCQNEYIEITENGKFLSTDLEKEGTWQLNGDTLYLRKQNGWVYKNLLISKVTKDSLIMTDKKRTSDDVFIEVYRVCDINDTTFKDTREIKEVRKSWGIIAGAQYFKAAYIDIGLARSKFEWNNIFYAMSLNFELAPWQNHYGASVNFWSEGILFYGVAAAGYIYQSSNNGQSTTNTAFAFRPMFGISAAKLLASTGMTAHLYYSYNFILGQGKLDYINQHAITLHAYLPFKSSVKKVRRIVREGLQY